MPLKLEMIVKKKKKVSLKIIKRFNYIKETRWNICQEIEIW